MTNAKNRKPSPFLCFERPPHPRLFDFCDDTIARNKCSSDPYVKTLRNSELELVKVVLMAHTRI
jgi:hypothetical protein